MNLNTDCFPSPADSLDRLVWADWCERHRDLPEPTGDQRRQLRRELRAARREQRHTAGRTGRPQDAAQIERPAVPAGSGSPRGD